MCAPDIDTEATQRLAWRVPCDVAVLFFAVGETLRSRLGARHGRWLTDGELFDALLDCALLAWTLREPRARAPDPVVERDGYRCAVPGCTSRRNLHDHHIRFRSAGGSDAPDNRVTLCAFHHQRCLHAGLLRVSGRAPDGLSFELGLRPGALPLVRYRAGDISVPASCGRVRGLLDAELAERAAQLAADRVLRGADAVYVALAARLGLPLVTLDLDLRRRADGVVEVESVE